MKTVFVATSDLLMLDALASQYPSRPDFVDVRALPRNTTDEIRYAIAGWLQGMVEGTIPQDEEKRKTLELEARLHGLLVQQTSRTETSLSLDSQTIDKLLDFGPPRMTLNSASESRILDAKRASINLPNKDNK